MTDDIESVKLSPVGDVYRKIYIRVTLSVADTAVTIYRHESLTPERVLIRLIEFYKAWCANQPGGR